MIGPPGGDPGVHERANAWLGEEDLIAGPADRRVRVLRKTALVRAPSELGRRRAFLVEAFDRPGVDELVDRLRLRRHLRVALGDVDHLGAGRLAESGERSLGLGLRRRRRASRTPRWSTPVAAGSPFSIIAGGNLEQRSLREVADEAGIRAVIDDGRRTRLGRAN